jgi:threonine dehydratase
LIPLGEIERARETIAGAAVRTPLVRLAAPDAEIYLKLENLQPIGSFKIRGAVNAIRRAPAEEVAAGVVTTSAGNMAQGVAWAAREAGVPCTVIVPEHAPDTKVAAVERLGGRVVRVSFDEWWKALTESGMEGVEGRFIHPVEDELVMAGNGTIGLELLEELSDPDAVLIPFGGGGLTVGIASALRALRPETRVYPVEPETAAPLAASLEAGSPREVDYQPSFVDGAGARTVLPGMWPRVREVVDGSLVASIAETAAAVRLLAERARVVAEGAGALGVAAAVAGQVDARKIVCIVSGGNIDFSVLGPILAGEIPVDDAARV